MSLHTCVRSLDRTCANSVLVAPRTEQEKTSLRRIACAQMMVDDATRELRRCDAMVAGLLCPLKVSVKCSRADRLHHFEVQALIISVSCVCLYVSNIEVELLQLPGADVPPQTCSRGLESVCDHILAIHKQAHYVLIG